MVDSFFWRDPEEVDRQEEYGMPAKELVIWPRMLTSLAFFVIFRNAHLFIIFGGFVRNFWRVCLQFWLSVRNSV